MTVLPKGEVLEVLEAREAWLRVSSAKGTGWVAGEYTEPFTGQAAASEPAQAEKPAPSADPASYNVAGDWAAQDDPSVQHSIEMLNKGIGRIDGQHWVTQKADHWSITPDKETEIGSVIYYPATDTVVITLANETRTYNRLPEQATINGFWVNVSDPLTIIRIAGEGDGELHLYKPHNQPLEQSFFVIKKSPGNYELRKEGTSGGFAQYDATNDTITVGFGDKPGTFKRTEDPDAQNK